MARGASGVYGGVSAERRREIRREQLLDAAFDLLGTEGWRATTVRAVCSRAGLTPRYFYESFADLDALLVAVFERLLSELVAVVLAAVAGAPSEASAKAQAAIGSFVRYVTDDPRRARVAFSEAPGSALLAEHRINAVHAFAALIAEQGQAFYGLGAERSRLVDITAYMLAGGLGELLIAWLDGRIGCTRQELIADCSELFVATGESAAALARRAR